MVNIPLSTGFHASQVVSRSSAINSTNSPTLSTVRQDAPKVATILGIFEGRFLSPSIKNHHIGFIVLLPPVSGCIKSCQDSFGGHRFLAEKPLVSFPTGPRSRYIIVLFANKNLGVESDGFVDYVFFDERILIYPLQDTSGNLVLRIQIV